MKTMTIKKKKVLFGFTLLELLVVISIIGILVAMGAVAFTTAQKRGRDSKRRGDIQGIQKAYEQYFADNSMYSTTCETMATGYMPGGTPTDPQGSQSYTLSCDSDQYCICAELEDVDGGNATAPAPLSTVCDYAGSPKSHYCLSNLQ